MFTLVTGDLGIVWSLESCLCDSSPAIKQRRCSDPDRCRYRCSVALCELSAGADGKGQTAECLSNYTPKHSMEYSKWQDEASRGGSTTPDLNAPSEDMLTPADGSAHTGFRSEPALYF
ncbi:unnamed protein product [Ranitomeya imitator]|uniref:Uncharacterized protein n=1 Tax=Ranitomeya imitator TaxID=111125 RepID=A0ABN9L9K6_9NEOB|nr:unnamed protein product [Ranitomeya imitator]